MSEAKLDVERLAAAFRAVPIAVMGTSQTYSLEAAEHVAAAYEALALPPVVYPRSYSHRPVCSRRHPVPFPCDAGTLTPAAIAALEPSRG